MLPSIMSEKYVTGAADYPCKYIATSHAGPQMGQTSYFVRWSVTLT